MTGTGASSDLAASLDAQLALAVAGVAVSGTSAPCAWLRRAGDGYRPDSVCRGVVVAIDDGALLRFTLPAGIVDFVQLRLPALAGTYRVDRVAIAGEPLDALARRVVLVLNEQATVGDGDALTIASSERPPLFELDVRGLLDTASPAWTLELRVRREDALQASLDALGGDTAAQFGDVLALLRALGDRDFVQEAEQRRAMAELRAAGERADTRMGGAVDALQSLRSDAAAQHDALREASSQLEARLTAQLVATLDAQRSQLADVVMLLHAEAERDNGQRQALDDLQADVAALRHAIDNVFWKRWARRLLGRRT